jgi:hypothetical protein
MDKKGPNPGNYKIVKCKYWEKDGTCRYGTLCTFAHGDTEVRSKTDNLLIQGNQGMGFYDPMQGMQGMGYSDPNLMMNPYTMGFDPNLMMSMGQGGMMGFPQGFDPNLMMNPMGMGMNNPNFPMYGTGQQGSGTSGNNTNGNN